MKAAMTSAVLVASIATAMGAGSAAAVEQGGTNPNDSAPQQGGTAPTDTAPQQGGTAPTPAPEPSEPSAPAYVPGPGSIPAPPQEAPYQPYTAAPQYEESGYSDPGYSTYYSPVPDAPLQAPKPVAPVRPIAPPPNKIRVGNFVTDIPKGMSNKDVNSINAWSAYGEAKIAQNLIALGVPKDKASRQAAATIIGVALGGATGAAVGAVPGAIAGVLPGAIVGAGAGAGIGFVVGGGLISPPTAATSTAGGALIGLGVGAVGGAAAGALGGAALGATIGGTIGGIAAYTLGAGDPGAHPQEPWKLDENGNPRQPKHAKPAPVDPSVNQFELSVPAEAASKKGLPSVDYVVNYRGDVTVKVGAQTAKWSAEQAQAPYKALGPLGAQLEQHFREMTKQMTGDLDAQVPGSEVVWPQEAAGRHALPDDATATEAGAPQSTPAAVAVDLPAGANQADTPTADDSAPTVTKVGRHAADH
nr:hypothetical protein [Gordonia otitidis]